MLEGVLRRDRLVVVTGLVAIVVLSWVWVLLGAGGPMAALAPLVSEMAGVEKRSIEFKVDGMSRSIKVGDLLEQSLTGMPSMSKEGEPIYLENTMHPASTKLALAKAETNHFHAFGIDWDDASGTRNGHFAPFSWAG